MIVIFGFLLEIFMNRFEYRCRTELNKIQDLNNIINVSDFKDTKKIIEEVFRLYL